MKIPLDGTAIPLLLSIQLNEARAVAILTHILGARRLYLRDLFPVLFI